MILTKVKQKIRGEYEAKAANQYGFQNISTKMIIKIWEYLTKLFFLVQNDGL